MKTKRSDTELIGGRYRKLRCLGSGGEGTVYLVVHLSTEKIRAAKRLPVSENRDQIHELDMMKRLCHPSLPEIIDVIEEKEQIWLVMEYVSGQVLSKLAKRGLTAEQFFSIALGLLDVLGYLHTRTLPVLHLDVKPTNILIRKDGVPVLIDFGAAVFLRGTKSTAGCAGTPGFAAPEQYGGREVDARTDVYGFGASMYYCLYGCAPPAAKPGVRKKSELTGMPQSQVRKIGRILERCLQAEKEQRFQDCTELYRVMRRLRRRYQRKKQGSKAVGAFFLLSLSLLFLIKLPVWEPSGETDARVKKQYQELLSRSEGLGFVQALECLEQAAGLFTEDGRWAFCLLRRIEEDYVFSMEEEKQLKDLVYQAVDGQGGTILERLKENSHAYGRFAYQMGIAYWYFYDGPGAKSAASFWFREAILSQKEKGERRQEEWFLSASIHADIASYYEKLGKKGLGQEAEEYLTYWDDLCRLWRMDGLDLELPEVKRQIASELISFLAVRSAEFSGKRAYREVKPVLSTLETFVKSAEAWENRKEREVILEQYEAAKEAVERVFEDERGNTIDTESEETAR